MAIDKDPFANLSNYFALFGDKLASRVQDTTDALHVVGRDSVPDMSQLLRRPFDAQRHAIAAGAKALRTNKTLWFNAEMGTGKTYLSIATTHLHANGKPYRAIVVCPPHLKEKWVREIEATIPNVKATGINRYFELTESANNRTQPECAEWYVMSESTAKLGQPWFSVTEPAKTIKQVSCRDHVRRWVIGDWKLASNGKRIPLLYSPKVRCCPKCKTIIQRKTGPLSERFMDVEELSKRKLACEKCGEQLWQWKSQFDRWPVARFVNRKMRGMFKYLIVDELHGAKGEGSAIANSIGKLASAVDHVIGLTGTLLGGYATDIFYLLYRLDPTSMVQDGFRFCDADKFAERYGRIETVVVKKIKKNDKQTNSQSEGSIEKGQKRTRVRPGIMPTLFGHHLMNKTIFLKLDELAANLPEIDEQVIACEMDSQQAAVYGDLEDAMREHMATLMQMPNAVQAFRRLLIALMGFIDRPWDWGSIGYYDERGEYVEVFDPPSLSEHPIRPKERDLIDFVKAEIAANRQTWIFAQMTKTRDVQPRLAQLLEAEGIRTKILRSGSVPTDKREAWIEANGPKTDVIISHPMLVQTGLEFFDKPKRYNFCSIAWYQTGWSLYTLRQASRRHWRIGQDQLCKIRYFNYQATMQQSCMELMSAKLNASQQLEGRMDTSGLAALAAEMDSVEIALAKTLTEKLAGAVSVRNWELTGSK